MINKTRPDAEANESGSEAFHLKYRPNKLENVIGHEVAVTRLKGMVASGKFPNALLFVGPPSVGKTTLARALAYEINGKPATKQQDYTEINGNSERSIEDMRSLIQTSKFKPAGKKRIIVIDEAQGILGNQPAAAALLKPLEEPSKDTLFILCSMDPTKFQTSVNGKAILSRCSQFVLEAHTPQDLFKQAARIAKGESMSYVDKEVLKTVAKASGEGMRIVANLMQSLRDYYDGLGDDAPETLTPDDVTSVLSSTQSSDDKLVVQVMFNLFLGKYAELQKSLLYVADGFQFMNKLLWMSSFLLNSAVLKGERHPKVWFTPQNKEILALLKKANIQPSLGQLAAVQATLVEMKGKAQAFAVGEIELMSAVLYRLLKEIHTK